MTQQSENNETILITGASGVVADAAGKYLSQQGLNVIGVSRSVEHKKHYTETSQIDLLKKHDLKRLEEIMEDVDTVFHLAWNKPVENFDTYKAWKGNMQMFKNVLNSAKNVGVPVFINGSSIHAATKNIPAYTVDASLEETSEPYKSSIDPDSSFDLRRDQPSKLLDPRENNPDSPYGWTKIMTEEKLKNSVKEGNFELGISIRIGGVNSEDKQRLEGEPYYPTLYWSHKDLGRTIEQINLADREEKKGYHQFYGVSDNKGRIFNIENSFIGGKK